MRISSIICSFIVAAGIAGFFGVTAVSAETCNCTIRLQGSNYDISPDPNNLQQLINRGATGSCHETFSKTVDTDRDLNRTVRDLVGGGTNELSGTFDQGTNCLPVLSARGATTIQQTMPSVDVAPNVQIPPGVRVFSDGGDTCADIGVAEDIKFFSTNVFINNVNYNFFGYYNLILDCPYERPDLPEPDLDNATTTPTKSPVETQEEGEKGLRVPFSLPVSNSGCSHPLNPFGCVDIPTLIGRVINIGFSLLGTFALLWFVYAGIMWMFAAGNSERSSKALKMLAWGALGLLIIFASYAVTSFILDAFK